MQHSNIFQPPLPTLPGERFHWQGLHGAALSLALSHIIAQKKQPLLIIAPDSLTVSHLMDELDFFMGATHPFMTFPDWETLPYDHFSPHQDIISERLAALSRLQTLKNGALVTSISTLMHRLPPKTYLTSQSFMLKTGDKLDLSAFRQRLTDAGYQLVSQVREHGEFAIRGSIIDLFPMGSKTPYRLDLFDDEIDSIREFSTETQRTTDKIPEINLLPAKEFPLTKEAIEHFRSNWRNQFAGNPLKSPLYQDVSEGICAPGIEYYLPLFFDNTATLFDYLPENTLVILIGDIKAKSTEFWDDIAARFTQLQYDIERPLLPPSMVFIDPVSINQQIKNYLHVKINEPYKTADAQFATESLPALSGTLQAFIAAQSGRVLFCAESLGRREVILQLLQKNNIEPTFFHSWTEFLNSTTTYGIVVSPIENGFKLNEPDITVITESDIYGKRVMQRRLRKRSEQDTNALIKDLNELQLNDPVVHLQHGVGRYRGLQTLKVGDQINEFLTLEYKDNDKLYVPVTSLHLISRYTGSNAEHTPINKLGTEQWSKAKKRAAEKIRDVAAELLDLYAKRAARAGHTYTLDEQQYNTFISTFPFEETPDQKLAIEKVFEDMTSDKPMDRVVCGDVGFGKTEVALRAAFLAAINSKQVVMLVPTTLLAEQHFHYFQDRFADWPIRVESLSRFKTGKEQKNVLEKLATGQADIVIGTHKLLQNDIIFKDLGLMIVDEEHRFGVKQKERLKALRANVDILTLTATPIPRTLNMALSGIRDLSIIATPPAKRLSVKTFVHDYNDVIIKEAIQREIMRGGQVYFLHNDVATIHKKAEELKALLGEARVTIAHGQMGERELERVMTEFYHRHHNVLVCSTIIESGIDIPTANTIIMNRADKLGIAQLHQLRGRVGRSHHQAYAYLLIPSKKLITADALKRLEAIAQFDDLGIGFTLATHDLEIRGAGELLGEEQSGDMHEIGFTLYMDLLSRAVDSLKNGKEPELDITLLNQRSDIDLHITSLIPEDYLGDVPLRLQFYKRIAGAKMQQELDDIQVEMIDRFGLLPEPLKNLFSIAELKLKADQLGIIKLEAGETGGKIEFSDKPNINPETIIRLIQIKAARYKLEGPKRLRFTLPVHDVNERVKLIDEVLGELM